MFLGASADGSDSSLRHPLQVGVLIPQDRDFKFAVDSVRLSLTVDDSSQMPAVKQHQPRVNFPWCQTCTDYCCLLAANLPVQSTDLHGPPQVGFVFNPPGDAWEQSLEELRLVAEGNGGVANVSRTDMERPGLGKWCSNQARRTSPARQLTEPGRSCTWAVTKPKGTAPRQTVICQKSWEALAAALLH